MFFELTDTDLRGKTIGKDWTLDHFQTKIPAFHPFFVLFDGCQGPLVLAHVRCDIDHPGSPTVTRDMRAVS